MTASAASDPMVAPALLNIPTEQPDFTDDAAEAEIDAALAHKEQELLED